MTFSVDRLPFYNNFSWIEGVKIIAAGGANCGILAVYKAQGEMVIKWRP